MSVATASPIGYPHDRRMAPAASLWEAVRQVIHGSGSVQELAKRLKVPAMLLYRASTDPENPSGDHRKLPLDAVLPLTEATGNPEIIRYLARCTGHVLIPMPTAAAAVPSLL